MTNFKNDRLDFESLKSYKKAEKSSESEFSALLCGYTEWISNNYSTKEKCINKCNEAVRAIVSYFNELTVQVGYANGVYHCWCKDKDGNIVDPTSKQFDRNIEYTLIADRFLKKHEIELATGAIFLDT